MKHTQGKWEIVDCFGDLSIETSKPFQHICKITEGNYKEANARLIASAPELLQALKGLIRMFEQDHRDCDEWIQYINAEQAIAKAEGKE